MLKSTGSQWLDLAAMLAGAQWKFTPTLLGDRPVKVRGTISFNFKK